MKRLIVLLGLLWAMVAGATNITNYPVTNAWSSAEWFFLSSVGQQTNFNVPGNYVVSTANLNSASNSLVTQINSASNSLVTQMGTITNSYATNLSVQNLYASNAFVDNITVTNGITNLSLTANTVLKADANKRIASISGGTGALTNNGAGAFGWFTFASGSDILTYSNNVNTLVNSTSNSILSQATNAPTINVTNLFVSNAYITNLYSTTNFNNYSYITNLYTSNGYFTNITVNDITVLSNAYFSNIFVTNITAKNLYSTYIYSVSNFFDYLVVTNTVTANQVEYNTNLCTMAPDFSKGYCWISTNAAFTFLAPLNLNYTKAQTTVMVVTNSSGSAILATAPANVHVVPGSTMYITNATAYTWFHYPLVGTNVYAVPLF